MQLKLKFVNPEDYKKIKPAKDTLWVIPIGGLGEIGKNMLLLRYRDEIIIIDAGLMFPTEEMFGVDFVIPDITYLYENKDLVKALILTHAHEDHIGAVPYVLDKIRVPVYGTVLTLEIVKAKLKETEIIKEDLVFNAVEPGTAFDIGSFSIEAFRMVHSISEGVGLAINTPVGTVIHTGDFKIDSSPIDGKGTDLLRLAEYGSSGVLLLLSDSTYAERPGHSAPEKMVGRSLDEIFYNAPGRVIVTTFASSLHRIQQVIDIAQKHNKKLCIIGKSLKDIVKVSTRLNYLRNYPGMQVKVEEIDNVKDNNLVILTTGSQGEPLSALSLIATNNHKWVKVKKDDTIIISATPVPGNESTVNNIINLLFRLGADVIYSIAGRESLQKEQGSCVHSSGHGFQEDLKLLLKLVKPKNFVPVHGEYRHLVHHCRLASQMGVDNKNLFLIEDGMILELSKNHGKVIARIQAGDVLVDGLGVGDIGRTVLRDRYHLSSDGICTVVATIDRVSGSLVSGPEVITRGFVYFKEAKEMLDKSKEIAKATIKNFQHQGLVEVSGLKHVLKENLAKFYYKETKRRPMIVPIIMEI